MSLTKAKLTNISKVVLPPESVQVLFNPTTYEIESTVNYAEVPLPGLQMPVLQFTRGASSTLTVDLFLDRTSEQTTTNVFADRADVEADLDNLRKLARIDRDLHSPPVVRFEWGNRLEAGLAAPFEGVITSLKESMVLFTAAGKVARAKVHVVFKSYQPASVQRRTIPLSSPDRTRVRVVRAGETLAQLAYEAYGDATMWRLIALENGLTRVRFLEPGRALRIPAVT